MMGSDSSVKKQTETGPELINQIGEMLTRFKDELKEEMKSQTEEIKENVQEIRQIVVVHQEHIDVLKNENVELKRELGEARREAKQLMNVQEQYTKRQDVIVTGIPYGAKESTMDIAERLMELLQIELNPWELLNHHRLPPRRNGEVPYIMRFISSSIRDLILAKAKKVKITAADFGGDPKIKVYLNEHLTVMNHELLRKAKELRKINYRFVCSKNGNIFARESEESRTLLIKSEEQVDRILKLKNGEQEQNG